MGSIVEVLIFGDSGVGFRLKASFGDSFRLRGRRFNLLSGFRSKQEALTALILLNAS